MQAPGLRSRARGAFVLLLCLLLTTCRSQPGAGEPTIAFTTVPEAGSGGSDRLGTIAGRVTGARAGQKVVLFAKSGIWWVQPFVVRPFTSLDGDAAWKNSIHLGTDYAALLVESSYRPPSTIEALPPRGGDVLAVATIKGTGTFTPPARQTLAFSGYDWEIRRTPSDRGGPNEYDARNASVDADGQLHLLLTQRDGRWTSAEVKLTRALGYGTYRFVVRDASALDPAVALGMLTWDELGAEQNHREMDIEIGRWGDPANKDGQYVVQPHYVAANVFRFLTPAGRLTHAFRWEPGHVSFWTMRGAAAGTGGEPIARHDFTSGVPGPGAETVHLNLLYFRTSPTAPRRDVEIIIEKFEYLP